MSALLCWSQALQWRLGEGKKHVRVTRRVLNRILAVVTLVVARLVYRASGLPNLVPFGVNEELTRVSYSTAAPTATPQRAVDGCAPT
jgi:hypothetical protein